MPTTNFEFIALHEGHAKPQDRRRRLIRGHCMRGKNKRTNSRRTQRQLRQSAWNRHNSREGAALSTMPFDSRFSSRQFCPDDAAHAENQHASTHEASSATLQSKYHLQRPTLSTLSTPTLTRYIPAVSDRAMRHWSEFMCMKMLVYPIEPCVDFGKQNLSAIILDQSFLYSVQFSTCVMRAFLQDQPPVPITWLYLQGSIVLLNEKLSLGHAFLQSSTAYTVILLALTSSLLSDHVATRSHLLGLQKMVVLLGGSHYLDDNPLLSYKLSLLELTQYLNTGFSLPPCREMTQSLAFAPSPANCQIAPEIDLVDRICETKVAIIFHDLRSFTNVINKSLEQGRATDIITFQHQLNCIQMRLIRQQPNSNDFTELLRLGMLAFIAVTFRLSKGNTRYAYLCDQLHLLLSNADLASSKVPSIMLWTLVLGDMIGLQTNNPQLLVGQQNLLESTVSWDNARHSLQNVMWIDRIQSERGQVAFKRLVERKQGARHND